MSFRNIACARTSPLAAAVASDRKTAWARGKVSFSKAWNETALSPPLTLDYEYNDAADAYTVRQSDAHSWVEVYFPQNDAWVSFDPTPDAGIRK